MKKLILLAIIVISVCGACKKNSIKTILTTQECFNLKKDSNYLVSNIIGSWEWVTEYTINQITGEKMYKTPQSEGYSKTLFFYSSGKYQLYKNAILNREYKYKIARLFEYTNYYLDSNLVLGLHNNIDNSFQIWYYVTLQ